MKYYRYKETGEIESESKIREFYNDCYHNSGPNPFADEGLDFNEFLEKYYTEISEMEE